MTLADFLTPKVQAAARIAILQNENVSPVEEGNGIVVVREDSPEGRERLAKGGMVADRITVDSVSFLICNS
ncbi:MAG: hypothetical protein Q7R88_00845 [bacterium]|nr:hypothetical protein [bacterium]